MENRKIGQVKQLIYQGHRFEHEILLYQTTDAAVILHDSIELPKGVIKTGLYIQIPSFNAMPAVANLRGSGYPERFSSGKRFFTTYGNNQG